MAGEGRLGGFGGEGWIEEVKDGHRVECGRVVEDRKKEKDGVLVRFGKHNSRFTMCLR